jgi:hypothetical protein
MKSVFTLWNEDFSWTFFSTDIDAATKKAEQVCKERGWELLAVTKNESKGNPQGEANGY